MFARNNIALVVLITFWVIQMWDQHLNSNHVIVCVNRSSGRTEHIVTITYCLWMKPSFSRWH